jgi:hypothetical protein
LTFATSALCWAVQSLVQGFAIGTRLAIAQ